MSDPKAIEVERVDISDVDRTAPYGKHFDFLLLLKALHKVNYQDYLLSEYRAEPPACWVLIRER